MREIAMGMYSDAFGCQALVFRGFQGLLEVCCQKGMQASLAMGVLIRIDHNDHKFNVAENNGLRCLRLHSIRRSSVT